MYTSENGVQLFTNQYTMTERFRPLAAPRADGTLADSQVMLLQFDDANYWIIWMARRMIILIIDDDLDVYW